MGGCYSAFACSRKLRSRISSVLPVTERDRDDRSTSDGGGASSVASSASPSPSPRKHEDAGPLVVRTTATEFARRCVLGKELGRVEFGVTRRCRDAATGEALACKTIRRHRRTRGGAGLEEGGEGGFRDNSHVDGYNIIDSVLCRWVPQELWWALPLVLPSYARHQVPFCTAVHTSDEVGFHLFLYGKANEDEEVTFSIKQPLVLTTCDSTRQLLLWSWYHKICFHRGFTLKLLIPPATTKKSSFGCRNIRVPQAQSTLFSSTLLRAANPPGCIRL